MTITQLEYVLAVEKFKHFGKAAKSCNVSQPTLSMQIQKMEEDLKVIIFDRSKSPIITTDIGRIIIEQARIIIKEYKKIYEVTKNNKDEVAGSFRLAVIPTISPYLIPLFLKKFTQTFPHVELIIEELTTSDIIKKLETDEIDAGILATPLKNNQLIERVLYYESFFLFTAKDSPYFSKITINEDALDSKGLWLLSEGHCLRDQVMRVCRLKREKGSQVEFASGNLETLKNLVLKHGGYTLLPELMVNDLSSEEKKQIKEIVPKAPAREISLVHSRSYLKENILNSLEEMIIATLPKGVKSMKTKEIKIIPIT